MKNLLSIFAVLVFLMVSCGPSAKEIEEKRINDSIKLADSITLVTKEKAVADSIAKIDSIQKADSIAKVKKVK